MTTLITSLLILLWAFPAATPSIPVRVVLSPDQALRVSWQAPINQARAAVILRRTDGDQLIGVVEGSDGVWERTGGGIDARTVVHEGDTIWITSWDTRGALLAQGRAVVPWRAWLPVVRR